jgi:hypothetical protein
LQQKVPNGAFSPTNTHTRNYRRRHPFAMKLIANERG